MAQRYEVWDWKQGEKVIHFTVRDMHIKDPTNQREDTAVAVFPVNNQHSQLEQRRLAYKFRDYMNALEGARDQAEQLIAIK